MEYSNLLLYAFTLIFLTCRHLDASVSTYKSTFNGSSCELGDKTVGICLPIKTCPPAYAEIIEQIKHRTRAGKRKYPRCGFDGFDEIVCCSRIIKTENVQKDTIIQTEWPNYQSNDVEDNANIDVVFSHEWKTPKKLINPTKQSAWDYNKTQMLWQENSAVQPNTHFPVLAGGATASQPPQKTNITNGTPILSVTKPTNIVESSKLPTTHEIGHANSSKHSTTKETVGNNEWNQTTTPTPLMTKPTEPDIEKLDSKTSTMYNQHSGQTNGFNENHTDHKYPPHPTNEEKNPLVTNIEHAKEEHRNKTNTWQNCSTSNVTTTKYPENKPQKHTLNTDESPLNANISSSKPTTAITINPDPHLNTAWANNNNPGITTTVKQGDTSKIPNSSASNTVINNVSKNGSVNPVVTKFTNGPSTPLMNVSDNQGNDINWHYSPLDTNESNETQENERTKDVTAPRRKSDTACAEYLRDAAPTIELYILDGETVESGEFPHMVALGYDKDAGLEFACGGSLISDRFVLTAARCVVNAEDIPPSIARIGTVSLSANYDSTDTDYNVEETFVHPLFKYSLKYHDVALIRLTKAVVMSGNTHPACLYTSDEDPKEPLIITGWGQTDSAKTVSTSNTLLKANVSVVSLSECSPHYADQRFKKPLPNGLTSEQICAVDKVGHSDACYGDAGGPLQLETNVEGVFKIVGITSFGMKCGNGIPGVYMRVSKYLDWIESIVWP